MKFSDIFIASSYKLNDERKRIELIISRFTDKIISTQNHYLKTVIWEKHSRSFSESRKQDDFNKLVLNSDVFFLLVGDKIGELSYEEFQIAKSHFEKHKKPQKIVVLFKKVSLDIDEIDILEISKVKDLKKEILENEQFYYEFSNLDELENHIKFEIEHFVNDRSLVKPSIYEIIFNHINIKLIDNLGKNASYNKIQLIKILEPTRFIDGFIISEGLVDTKSIEFERGEIREIRKDLGKIYISVDLGRILNEGEMITHSFNCKLVNTFIKNDEFWEINSVSKSNFNKITVEFPKGRPCKSYESEITRNFQRINCIQPILRKKNNVDILDFEIITKQQYDKIRLKWKW